MIIGKNLGDVVLIEASAADVNEEGYVKIPEDVTKIGYGAFSNCARIIEIDIPQGVTSICDNAFRNCTSLEEIKIPEGVKMIGPHAFSGCTSLEKINIPEGITWIGMSTFEDCSNLKEVNIPEGVTKIDPAAFRGCTSLKKIIIPESVTWIYACAFEECTSLKEVNISEGVTEIGISAFNRCTSLEEIKIPQSVINIREAAFYGCASLKKIIIPESVTGIHNNVFRDCDNLKEIHIKNPKLTTGIYSFDDEQLNFIYINKDGTFNLCRERNEELEKTALMTITKENKYGYKKYLYLNSKFRNNLAKATTWKNEGKVKFIPPAYTLELFPEDEFEKYYLNKNNQRWGKLVKELGFTGLEGDEKNNSLRDLMKIYYAIGGFSEDQGESERAYEYIKNYVAKTSNPNASPSEIGAEIHRRFSKINLEGPYNKDFATFFMKYYKDDPDFMCFRLKDADWDLMDPQDYLCKACNNFSAIQRAYPNRVVNTNEERALLSPRFVAEHSDIVQYEYVDEGNEELASLVGRYGYSQRQFDRIQEIYNHAKTQKDKYFISADRANEEDPVQYRLLDKDDPLGFVLGDITNCCQHIDGAADSCVDDGYTNPEAGFIVFEETIKDENGKPTGEKRILGQAYVWYDPQTKTVCFDNIEIPTKVLDQLRKKTSSVSVDMLLSAVEKSADAIMRSMNREGKHLVERVTTGEGYNDLKNSLSRKYKREVKPIALHRNYSGYSDARTAQYVLRTYDGVTKGYSDIAREEINLTQAEIQNNLGNAAQNNRNI